MCRAEQADELRIVANKPIFLQSPRGYAVVQQVGKVGDGDFGFIKNSVVGLNDSKVFTVPANSGVLVGNVSK